MSTVDMAVRLSDAIADQLADPDQAPVDRRAAPWWRQSLAHGVPGIALLHIERAAAGLGPWQRAGAWLAAAVSGPITGGAHSHPNYGALPVAYALRCASEHRPAAYTTALTTLDTQIDRDIARRLDQAHGRLDSGQPPELADFDAIHGLTGYGAYLLRRDGGGELLSGVLSYLVGLTHRQHSDDGTLLPGWWVPTGPSGRNDARFPDGHANTGVAHGIAGPLALLALATRRGVTVSGQAEAITTICRWLDRRQHGTTWPYWITPAELHAGRSFVTNPVRPSWCYGAAGVARAMQLAGQALADTDRQQRAAQTLAAALTDPQQLAATSDPSLCHGFAGLAHLAARVAADESATDAAAPLHAVIPDMVRRTAPSSHDATDLAQALIADAERGPGLFDGAAGIALALHATTQPPVTRWDSCLLIT